jgi:hypothetical protein
MHIAIQKIDALLKAIDIVVSKNRHVLLFDDEILARCLKKLKRLKTDVIKSGDVSNKHIHRFVKIIALLDEFFGLEEHILQSLDVVE